MSEYINNQSRRVELLQEIFKGLHEGKTVEETRKAFTELVKIADAGEIAEAEQMLIAKGLPVEEVQNLCDLHVAVMRDELNGQRAPQSVPGHPVYTFAQENQKVLDLLDQISRVVSNYVEHGDDFTRQELLMMVERLTLMQRHYLRKENLLFPILERYNFSGPSQVMWGLHDQVRKQLAELAVLLRDGTEACKVEAAFKQVATPIREMAYKEEKILFPAAMERLSEEDWAQIRANEAELGYFLVEPGQEWKPTVEHIIAEEMAHLKKTASTEAAPDGLLSLHTGALSGAQIDLLLRNLPVDVTFVDENDSVRYFSQSKDRIFERQATIIGRKVQNCHPPQSVDKVQKILDDFRAGTRNQADFWIQMGPRFVLIQYMALRDTDGSYRGCLEVSQDIAGHRALTGEKRLLDD